MRFVAHQDVFERFPGLMLAVAVAFGIDNTGVHSEIEREWLTAWQGAAAEAARFDAPQAHPSIVPWRERFKAMGVSVKEFRSSAEALFRRAARGGEPFRINPLVDFYNAISLRHLAPAGAFDLAQLEQPLELRLTRAGDTFTPLESDDTTAVELPPGEVSYATGSTVLTRHFVWRQSREGLITGDSTDVFLVSEILAELGHGEALAIRDEFADGLRQHFGVPSLVWIVDAAHPSIGWEDQRR